MRPIRGKSSSDDLAGHIKQPVEGTLKASVASDIGHQLIKFQAKVVNARVRAYYGAPSLKGLHHPPIVKFINAVLACPPLNTREHHIGLIYATMLTYNADQASLVLGNPLPVPRRISVFNTDAQFYINDLLRSGGIMQMLSADEKLLLPMWINRAKKPGQCLADLFILQLYTDAQIASVDVPQMFDFLEKSVNLFNKYKLSEGLRLLKSVIKHQSFASFKEFLFIACLKQLENACQKYLAAQGVKSAFVSKQLQPLLLKIRNQLSQPESERPSLVNYITEIKDVYQQALALGYSRRFAFGTKYPSGNVGQMVMILARLCDPHFGLKEYAVPVKPVAAKVVQCSAVGDPTAVKVEDLPAARMALPVATAVDSAAVKEGLPAAGEALLVATALDSAAVKEDLSAASAAVEEGLPAAAGVAMSGFVAWADQQAKPQRQSAARAARAVAPPTVAAGSVGDAVPSVAQPVQAGAPEPAATTANNSSRFAAVVPSGNSDATAVQPDDFDARLLRLPEHKSRLAAAAVNESGNSDTTTAQPVERVAVGVQL